MKRLTALFMAAVLVLGISACGRSEEKENIVNVQDTDSEVESVIISTSPEENEVSMMEIPENFVLIEGGTFQMGSPETESWRSDDETQHTVTVSDFYMSQYELTQEEYEKVMGKNPSNFSGGDLPVENISWLDAVSYCNSRSESEGRTPVYTIDGQNISWDRSANGYRLPTEAEWEYACRAGTVTPFNTEASISAEEANYYGHYPYMIEDNYFSQGNLDTQPGEYRQTTVAVGSFAPNAFGLYNTHGNVGEWVWDYYGEYPKTEETDPAGPDSGTLRVYRGGGWNDFAKNMRSAYRATLAQDKGSFNIGMRLVLNAAAGSGSVTGTALQQDREASENENVLIAYFSWGGNTAGIAGEIQRQTGADLFEITLVNPYSNDYNTVLDEAQRDQNEQARPELVNHIENMGDYDVIILGYPNWWASIPMPIASFLEEYDFEGKTIIPFCSHGGGRFGQSLTAIAKLAPDAVMGEALSVRLDLGVNFFDTAIAYQSGTSEQYLGRALWEQVKREDVVVATKFLPRTQDDIRAGITGQQHIERMINRSLANLGMDYVDLYIYHMWDYETPLYDIMEGLNNVVRAGKARYIGISNCFAYQLAKANALAEKEGFAKFVSVQGHYNLIFREEEREMAKLCREDNIAMTPYSALAGGRLARLPGESSKRLQEDSYARLKYDSTAGQDGVIIDRVAKLAGQKGVSMTEVSLAWLLTKATSPVVGATKLHHIEGAAKATELELSAEELSYLEEPYVPHKLVGVMAQNTQAFAKESHVWSTGNQKI